MTVTAPGRGTRRSRLGIRHGRAWSPGGRDNTGKCVSSGTTMKDIPTSPIINIQISVQQIPIM